MRTSRITYISHSLWLPGINPFGGLRTIKGEWEESEITAGICGKSRVSKSGRVRSIGTLVDIGRRESKSLHWYLKVLLLWLGIQSALQGRRTGDATAMFQRSLATAKMVGNAIVNVFGRRDWSEDSFSAGIKFFGCCIYHSGLGDAYRIYIAITVTESQNVSFSLFNHKDLLKESVSRKKRMTRILNLVSMLSYHPLNTEDTYIWPKGERGTIVEGSSLLHLRITWALVMLWVFSYHAEDMLYSLGRLT
jgi:hypothetical protein